MLHYLLLLFYYSLVSSMETDIYNRVKHLISHRGHKVPELDDIRYNISLMLGNSHVSMGSAMPLPQSYKPVGGYHIESQPLPEVRCDVLLIPYLISSSSPPYPTKLGRHIFSSSILFYHLSSPCSHLLFSCNQSFTQSIFS
jgi:hypothetical protein